MAQIQDNDNPQNHQTLQIPSPSKDPEHKFFRRGDLVRVSEYGIEKSKRLKDREGFLGRIVKCTPTDDSGSPLSFLYDVEWVLGGRLNGCEREDLVYRTADEEGMTDSCDNRRRKRKPVDFMEDIARLEQVKKTKKTQQQVKHHIGNKKHSNGTDHEILDMAPSGKKFDTKKSTTMTERKKAGSSKTRAPSKQATTPGPKRLSTEVNRKSEHTPAAKNKRASKKDSKPEPPVEDSTSSTSLDMYERHTREFNRIFTRLKEKIDLYRHFWSGAEEIPPEYIEVYDDVNNTRDSIYDDDGDRNRSYELSENDQRAIPQNDKLSAGEFCPFNEKEDDGASIFPSHPPFNWEMLERRMKSNRYRLDRLRQEENERLKLLQPYHQWRQRKSDADKTVSPSPRESNQSEAGTKLLEARPTNNTRVAYPYGIDWNLFREDVFGMCDAALARSDMEDDDGQRGSLSHTIKKIKDNLDMACERTGTRHVQEMAAADDRHKFSLAVEGCNNKEAAMQSWRKEPFPERRYEQIFTDSVCSGLSKVDERIASYELQTNLPDSFIGQSYHYNDTSLSEVWMKSVVDETGSARGPKKATSRDEKREAALALTADEGVTRAQVSATMQALLVAVQDRVMTELKVLEQRELRSEKWLSPIAIEDSVLVASASSLSHASQVVEEPSSAKFIEPQSSLADQIFSSDDLDTTPYKPQSTSNLCPEILEQPVWGIDCYSRKNMCACLELEFDAETSLAFIEKWLLPAINACPEHLAHNIGNAARILEGLPFDYTNSCETDQDNNLTAEVPTMEEWSRSLLARALLQKIRSSAPPWLHAAANQLRRAREALGPNFFCVHPKGHGSVLLCQKVKANSLITFYHGELYPSWRWGEKMDAIEITQQRKDLKPALPDFYNMALERPQKDPRGYGLLFVDASRKAGHGSSLSHSCAPTCEVRVAAVNGELCLAMTTLRELEMGEELTFDYNAVTESLNEYQSAVCLCGYGKCRGSFLHFATADCYQQILARNSPIASRFASLVKGSMKKVMSDDDDKVLRCHGFLTAAFGAISVNRHEVTKNGHGESLVDSLNMVPVWLRTYVADTLRYIEYERRALPIALICDTGAVDETLGSGELDGELDSQLMKEPKQEPSFFFFSRTQTDFLNSLLEKEGLANSLTGLQRKHAMQRVASMYWQELSEEEKQGWKEKSRVDYEKKMKTWRAAQKANSRNEKSGSISDKSGKRKIKPGISDILNSSKIAFQEADAEGVSAMEQRIQQLTQTLSRVGRVLDRHRELTLQEAPLDREECSDIYEKMQARVHQPLHVLTETDVVGWIWNSHDGLVCSLMRGLETSRCARPCLLADLMSIKGKYADLENFGDPTKPSTSEQLQEPGIVCVRAKIKEALLAMRNAILDDLNKMSVIFKQFNAKKSLKAQSLKGSVARDDNLDDNSDHGAILSVSTSVTKGSVSPSNANSSQYDIPDTIIHEEFVDKTQQCHSSDEVKPSLPEKLILANTQCDTLDERSVSSKGSNDTLISEFGSWVLYYGERFTLEASADLLLLYAHTTNFFAAKHYQELESSPVEVYARELGNSVPRSVIDDDLQCEDFCMHASGTKEDEPKQAKKEGKRLKSRDRNSSKGSTKQARKDSELCLPDEIVAKVTVKYQGDYVLSQLLQWYNGGIGQKPGLPDMMGCVYLPSMSGCWNSELLATNRSKAERKTTYETKIRPRLIEWLQDQYERGNAWPSEIRKAFAVHGDTGVVPKDASGLLFPFGSPVLDFLVSGDETNLFEILRLLDADERRVVKSSTDGMLTSVDKGRPAQAVSTWVQCEICMKWRKIPWHVDADMLPEKFYCSDNKWNLEANTCDAPEDDWDEADALVGADGKVEGSPLKKGSENGSLSILDEKCFTIGAKFDVRMKRKNKFSIGAVTKVDFSGLQKRVMFHFAKTTSDRDEWIEFGSDRIKPLYSKVPRQHSKRDKGKVSEVTKEIDFTVDKNSFTIGARFDVRRSDKAHFSNATVTNIDVEGDIKKVKFHFAKTSTCRDEWVDIGSDRIAPFNTKSCMKNSSQVHCDSETKSEKIEAGKGKKGPDVKIKKDPKTKFDKLVSKNNKLGKSGYGSGSNSLPVIAKTKTLKVGINEKVDTNIDNGEASNELGEKVKDAMVEEKLVEEKVEGTAESAKKRKEKRKASSKELKSHKRVKAPHEDRVAEMSMIIPEDSVSEKDFKVGARFDVLRTGKKIYYAGVVKDINLAARKILFHFPKTDTKFDEWIEFGSPRICALNTKVVHVKKNKSGKQTKVEGNYTSVPRKPKEMSERFEVESTSNGNPAFPNADGAPTLADQGDVLRVATGMVQALHNNEPSLAARSSPSPSDNPLEYDFAGFSRPLKSTASVSVDKFNNCTPEPSATVSARQNIVSSEGSNRSQPQFSVLGNFQAASPPIVSVTTSDTSHFDGNSHARQSVVREIPRAATAFDKLLLLASASHGHLEHSVGSPAWTSPISEVPQSQGFPFSQNSGFRTESQHFDLPYNYTAQSGYYNESATSHELSFIRQPGDVNFAERPRFGNGKMGPGNSSSQFMR